MSFSGFGFNYDARLLPYVVGPLGGPESGAAPAPAAGPERAAGGGSPASPHAFPLAVEGRPERAYPGDAETAGKITAAYKIRRPPNAFMVFANEHRKLLARAFPNENNQAISVRLGTMWKAMGPDYKSIYYQMAKDAAAEHKRMYPSYVYSPKEARMRKQARELVRREKTVKPVPASPATESAIARNAGEAQPSTETRAKLLEVAQLLDSLSATRLLQQTPSRLAGVEPAAVAAPAVARPVGQHPVQTAAPPGPLQLVRPACRPGQLARRPFGPDVPGAAGRGGRQLCDQSARGEHQACGAVVRTDRQGCEQVVNGHDQYVLSGLGPGVPAVHGDFNAFDPVFRGQHLQHDPSARGDLIGRSQGVRLEQIAHEPPMFPAHYPSPHVLVGGFGHGPLGQGQPGLGDQGAHCPALSTERLTCGQGGRGGRRVCGAASLAGHLIHAPGGHSDHVVQGVAAGADHNPLCHGNQLGSQLWTPVGGGRATMQRHPAGCQAAAEAAGSGTTTLLTRTAAVTVAPPVPAMQMVRSPLLPGSTLAHQQAFCAAEIRPLYGAAAWCNPPAFQAALFPPAMVHGVGQVSDCYRRMPMSLPAGVGRPPQPVCCPTPADTRSDWRAEAPARLGTPPAGPLWASPTVYLRAARSPNIEDLVNPADDPLCA